MRLIEKWAEFGSTVWLGPVDVRLLLEQSPYRRRILAHDRVGQSGVAGQGECQAGG